MPPFIRFTRKTESSAGTQQSFVYVNVAHIVVANYDDTAKVLEIECIGTSQGRMKIRGEEAEAALHVLQTVSNPE